MASTCISPPIGPYPSKELKNSPKSALPHYTASRQSLVSVMAVFLYLAKLMKEKILNLPQGEPLLRDIKKSVGNDYQKMEAFAVILCKSTTTDELKSAVMKEYRGNDELIEVHYNNGGKSSTGYDRITIVIDEDTNEAILRDARRLSSAVFEDLLKDVKLNVIREGSSFTITCSFPLILSEQLITAHDDIDKILEGNQVKRLTNGYCINDTMESDEQQFPLSSASIGLLKQQMESGTLMEEAESLKEVLDTKIKMMNSIAESAEYDELKETKDILEEQLASFQLSDQVPQYEVQDYFTRLNETLPLMATAVNKLVSDTKGLVDEATSGLEEIREHSEVKEVSQVKESYRSLSKTTEAVHSYLDKVNGLYRLLNEQTPDVIEDIESGRLKSTEQLAVEIERILQDSTRHYEILDACCKEFTTNCNSAQQELTRLKEEQESRKKAAAIAAGATAAAGLPASILIGAFTFGIGAAVGAAVTASAAAAAATGLAVATVLVASIGKTVESYCKIDGSLGNLQFKLIQDMVKEVHPTINEKVKRMTDTECTDLAMKMRSTLEQSKRLYSETSSGVKVAEEIKRAFADKVSNVF
ncbi:PREDICTED: uncharacterized protein LOC100632970 [Amphimedon queenslandica]|uniref:Uncharacterized protein n=1 Tax=Amphimedon queenslandica TaxID=400682 RepID=A0A1X7TV98_AMPQE|nr:PREDICTED: uncharacterized protein LOC100632970 [Amphimedon queenslandica]|eukprot:XP_003389740.1 PREDICTED: uncharacterized protein LOC100632970 [Amphimedon queenslandica]